MFESGFCHSIHPDYMRIACFCGLRSHHFLSQLLRFADWMCTCRVKTLVWPLSQGRWVQRPILLLVMRVPQLQRWVDVTLHRFSLLDVVEFFAFEFVFSFVFQFGSFSDTLLGVRGCMRRAFKPGTASAKVVMYWRWMDSILAPILRFCVSTFPLSLFCLAVRLALGYPWLHFLFFTQMCCGHYCRVSFVTSRFLVSLDSCWRCPMPFNSAFSDSCAMSPTTQHEYRPYSTCSTRRRLLWFRFDCSFRSWRAWSRCF